MNNKDMSDYSKRRALKENGAKGQRHGTSKFQVELLQLIRRKVELKYEMQEEHLQLCEGLKIPLSHLEFLEPQI
jgi:hypothetical protein